MSMDDETSRRKIKENLQETLKIYENVINDIADPAKADLQVLYDYQKQKIMAEKGEVSLSATEQLKALDELEKWFTSRDLQYPLPDRLQEQRAFWKSK